MEAIQIVKLEKIEELSDAKNWNNIEVGFVKTGQFVEPPKVGEPFYLGLTWRTSRVTEIIDSNTFKTMNSIYSWVII